MISASDIIVTSPDSSEITLIAETMLSDANLETTESQIKRYMLDVSCPAGLLVTPNRFRIYRNLYLSNSPDSIELVGEFPTSKVMGSKIDGVISANGESLFAQTVQTWLQQLATSLETSRYDSAIRKVLNQYVLPALSGGIVRAGGPRHL